MNAFLIYINAAGMNTVTRQSPFDGVAVNANLDSLKRKQPKTASILNLSNQINWYPDYKMIQYIDTLKQKLSLVTDQKASLINEFAYVKDRIYSVTKDTLTANQVKSFLRDFGRYIDE